MFPRRGRRSRLQRAKPIITIPSQDFNRISKMFSFSPSFQKNSIVSHKSGGGSFGAFYRFAMRTAVSKAISIISVRELCRSAGGSSSLVTRLSVTAQMVNARFPASAAVV